MFTKANEIRKIGQVNISVLLRCMTRTILNRKGLHLCQWEQGDRRYEVTEKETTKTK